MSCCVNPKFIYKIMLSPLEASIIDPYIFIHDSVLTAVEKLLAYFRAEHPCIILLYKCSEPEHLMHLGKILAKNSKLT